MVAIAAQSLKKTNYKVYYFAVNLVLHADTRCTQKLYHSVAGLNALWWRCILVGWIIGFEV